VSSNVLSSLVESGIDLSDIEQCLIYQFKSEADLVDAISELNTLYVHQRSNLKQNSLTPRLASAYLQLYFTTNIPKLFKLLKFLPIDLVNELAKHPWIDFGSGPATYTLAWYSWLKSQKKKYPPKSLLIERDLSMQALINNVLDKYLPDEDITIVSELSQKTIPNGVLFFGHSSNELSLEQLFSIFEKATPRFVILLEPGTPEVFKKALELRSHLMAHNYKILYPCSTQSNCPIKQQSTAKNWCHQYLSLKFSPSVERLTQLASLKRQHSAVVFHVYEKMEKKLPLSSSEVVNYRVVQGPMQNKGIWTWQVCTPKGNLEWLETLTRQYSKDQLDNLEKKSPGEHLNSVTIQKELKPGFYRVLIGEL
jgi:ribosomal protein RSM22 (predicted rRNA methylase)